MAVKLVAAGLSALLPGTGQLITHHWVKGAAFLLGALITSGMIRRGSFFSAEFRDDSLLHLVLVLVLLALSVWSALDAFRSSKGQQQA